MTQTSVQRVNKRAVWEEVSFFEVSDYAVMVPDAEPNHTEGVVIIYDGDFTGQLSWSFDSIPDGIVESHYLT